jgi:mono/diheme cytochrome c family protein
MSNGYRIARILGRTSTTPHPAINPPSPDIFLCEGTNQGAYDRRQSPAYARTTRGIRALPSTMTNGVTMIIHRITLSITTLASVTLALHAASTKSWKVPESAEKVKNPIKSTEASLDTGKKLYAQECQDCHGKTGRGDGPGAKDLELKPPSLRSDEFQCQSDGALFYKITKGRSEMPSYRKSLTDDERWHVVNYLRTFAEVKTAHASGENR